MISREYGGPSKFGGTSKITVTSAGPAGQELVHYVDGQANFQPASFVIKASVPVYVGHQRADSQNSGNSINTHSFELETGVYWRVDVDRPEERAIAFLPISADGYVKITRISDINLIFDGAG